jgi:hypothetical protein
MFQNFVRECNEGGEAAALILGKPASGYLEIGYEMRAALQRPS